MSDKSEKGSLSDISVDEITQMKNSVLDSSCLESRLDPSCVLSELGLSDVSVPRFVAEKRGRSLTSSEENQDDDGFITVQRKSKKLARSYSINNSTEVETRAEAEKKNKFEVCVTAKTFLPKQIGMAKLLMSENIQDILKIKYKNPYKVLIEFKDKENAEKLLQCKKFIELDYRCQMTNDVNITYGIVKEMDLDTNEEEMLKTLTCETDILAVKRLKRIDQNGQWIDSETVRFSFKGSVLPSYICGFGCRFRVDPYTFPVTQCSNCWKYGHLRRGCPSKRSFCPKCGEDHLNCESKTFTCVNCKGSHMALDKSCPTFLKEKEIRDIMRLENITYRKALHVYLKKREYIMIDKDYDRRIADVPPTNFTGTTYRDVVIGQMHQEEVESMEEGIEEHDQNVDRTNKPVKSNKKKFVKKQNNNRKVNENIEAPTKAPNIEEEITKERKLELKILLKKAKEIFTSAGSLEEKIISVIKFIVSESMAFIVKIVRDGEIVGKLWSSFING